MLFPSVTSFYAGLFAIIYVGLSGWVIGSRVQEQTLFGTGDDPLTRRVRSHGNFAEYVPLALLLIALLEAGGASRVLIQVLCLVLLVARLIHPVGMFAPENSPQQFACRGGGIAATLLVILVTGLILLVRSA